MMKHLFSLVAVVALGSTSLLAQKVEQGKQFLYYHRYNSAKETLEKILEKNPNDAEAVYWLGQTQIEMGGADSLAVKDLYQKALANNGDAPLLVVGMGEIDLMDGKKEEARQRFEAAITMTKGKDVDIYNAIARANIEAKTGDMQYAIEKLNQATEVKKFSDPTTYLLMGDAYRKLVDGGNAVLSYEKAYNMDNSLAAAKYSEGKIYLTQKNYSLFIKYMNDALVADPNYAPAYYDLYVYWYERDVNEARDAFAKYVAVADATPTIDYDRTSIIYAAREYQEAIDTAKSFIAKLGDKADPRYYKLTAYSYAALKDTANAKEYMDQYFVHQPQSQLVPMDYAFHAELLSKFPGNEQKAFSQFEQAVALDTTFRGKLKLMDQAARLAKKVGDHKEEANWYGKIYRTDTAASNRDLYNWGYALYQSKQFDSALNVFKSYKEKYPDEIYGFLWAAYSAQGIDTVLEMDIAAPQWQDLADAALRIDSAKLKPYAIQSYGVLAQYYNNVKKDKDQAIEYLKKILAIDPQNADAQRFIDILERAAQQQQGGSSGSSTSKSSSSSSGKK